MMFTRGSYKSFDTVGNLLMPGRKVGFRLECAAGLWANEAEVCGGLFYGKFCRINGVYCVPLCHSGNVYLGGSLKTLFGLA